MESPISISIAAGLEALEQGHYQEAIAIFEAVCQNSAPGSRDLLRARMHLVKTYQSCGQIEQATVLCQELTACANAPVQLWAEQALKQLLQPEIAVPPTQDPLAPLPADVLSEPKRWRNLRSAIANVTQHLASLIRQGS